MGDNWSPGASTPACDWCGDCDWCESLASGCSDDCPEDCMADHRGEE